MTAPGFSEHRAFVPGRPGDHGVCTCGAGSHLALWNAGASSRWNHLRTLLTREVEGLRYFKATEVQKRGALHHHALVWSPRPLSPLEVQGLALRAGYGCVMDLMPVEADSRQVARYLAKTVGGYVSKATDQRSEVPWQRHGIDYDTGEITGPVGPETYRTWSSSRDWGMTMKALREEAREWAREHIPDADGLALDQVVNVLGGVELAIATAAPPG